MYTTLGFKLPAYLNEIMHEDMSSNGVIHAVMNIIGFTSIEIGGSVSEQMIQRKYATPTTTRKLYSIVSGFGSLLLFVLLAGCNRLALRTVLYLGSFCLASASASDIPIASEMSALFLSIFNIIQMSSDIITPSFVVYLLGNSTDLRALRAFVFYYSSSLIAIATVVPVALTFAERQRFDSPADDDETINQRTRLKSLTLNTFSFIRCM